jgi:hypothetical protein
VIFTGTQDKQFRSQLSCMSDACVENLGAVDARTHARTHARMTMLLALCIDTYDQSMAFYAASHRS